MLQGEPGLDLGSLSSGSECLLLIGEQGVIWDELLDVGELRLVSGWDEVWASVSLGLS